MFTPLLDKMAEPPPPEGVSTKEWDHMLQEGPKKTVTKTANLAEEIRKTAQRVAFEELTAPRERSALEIASSEKFASVEDQALLKVASDLSFFESPQWEGQLIMERVDDILHRYEELGGTYKYAFGQQMFDSKQMAGSPAVSGGMAARARNPAPQMQSAPVSVTTTSIGGQNNGQQGQQGQTSQASTPSAPTG
jgi:hypothetical protein